MKTDDPDLIIHGRVLHWIWQTADDSDLIKTNGSCNQGKISETNSTYFFLDEEKRE